MSVPIKERARTLLGLPDASKAGEMEELISTWLTTISTADIVQFKRMQTTAAYARLWSYAYEHPVNRELASLPTA